MKYPGLRFLVVEDDDAVGSLFRRILTGYGEVILTTSVTSASEALRTARVHGLLVDLRLPDGSGLDVIRLARSRFGSIPALVCSGAREDEWLSASHAVDAHFLRKPVELASVEVFAERAARAHTTPESIVHAALVSWNERHALTPVQLDLVERAAHGLTAADVAVSRGVLPNTVKKQIHQLLERVSGDSFADVGNRILWDALNIACGTDGRRRPGDE